MPTFTREVAKFSARNQVRVTPEFNLQGHDKIGNDISK
jgi:hypothetical protein